MSEPAFPTNYFYDQNTEHEVLPMPGMTLRDYFAAKVIEVCVNHTSTLTRAAEEAYKIADAMMKARDGNS
jgi:uncharacterized protein YqiB (DUF1249 family)